MKPKFHSIALAAFFALLPHSAQAETVLTGVEIRDMASCRAVLAEFNWVCQEFNHDGWVRTFGYRFWGRGSLQFYRHDIDGDSTEDGIVKVEHLGLCSRGGPVCSFYFLFGDQPEMTHPHTYSLMGLGPIVSGKVDGTNVVYFSDEEYRNGLYDSVSDIRKETLSSDTHSIEKRGADE